MSTRRDPVVEPDQRPASAPVTARGAKTRARLVVAARVLFERQGYLDTNVNDIAKQAKVAYGTFYIYFSSREEVFEEVVKAHVAQFEAIASSEPPAGPDPAARIERANRGYLKAYQQTSPMMGLLEQVATFNPRLGQIRRDAHRYWVERARRAIVQWQYDGIVERDVDAMYAASALGGMVSRFAYGWIVLGDHFDLEIAVDQLTHLYCRSLGIAHTVAPHSI